MWQSATAVIRRRGHRNQGLVGRAVFPGFSGDGTTRAWQRLVKNEMTRPEPDHGHQGHHHGSVFHSLARRSSESLGSPWAFMVALLVVLAWAVSGPFFHYSDTWQLVINTGTTVVTFLMVFLIQNTQNRESLGLRLKLDELIRAMDSARNEFIGVEDLDDADLDLLRREFVRLREKKRLSDVPNG
jgi:low affinity Fe/Cu permease